MSFLDPVMMPLMKLGPFWAVIFVSVVMTLVVTFAYKYLTNQEKMKSLKEEQKHHQKRMKEFKHDPAKMMEIQKQAMSASMEYMKHSFKPMIFTMIPILLVFGWMNAHMAYYPIVPGEEFSATAFFDSDVEGDVEMIVPSGIEIIDSPVKEINEMVSWKLKGEAGEYLLEYKFDGKSITKEIIITEEQAYSPVIEKTKDKELVRIELGNPKLKVLNLFGWKLGWLGTYIIISIVFSMGLRKALKIH